jgi:glycosyltransferase involved in cell wall biosynthesis
MGQALPSRLAASAHISWLSARLRFLIAYVLAPGGNAGVRRIGTGLFQPGPSLYKARAARGRMPPLGLLAQAADVDDHSLFDQGINLDMAVALSVVVPVKDEAENVAPLAREIAGAVGPDAEIVFVDDGSSDTTAEVLRALKSEIPSLRILSHGRNIGQSRAIRTGVRAARGEIIATLDGDGQNAPQDIPKLVRLLREAPDSRVGMVSGVRHTRMDNANKRYASGFANSFRRRLLKDGAVDSGCGLKAFRREAFLALPYFDNMHRFLIALMQREGYAVLFEEVEHRPRTHGASKYNNLHRALVGFTDTFGVRWLQHRFKGAVEPKEL